ncbi:MBL fold metallo-hydrolase [Flavobacterium urocaniciphilum]|uniref:Phosphoribosyl 1,2-cyclic phosphate phosphodiesterase n=1 Tax=Flavobacterium urocaniciphilum TaxID=1299341 RepID=A0A1H8YSX0_9FLAO|nr:MBL fold metallo-hydrolase [Flavobacterium urocaniciphilum]SEP55295.1 phosphoribosyl 1,2-cyclic phosphate phosphodiesterase [Flavobacterium urocaniciphilum]
MKVYFLGTGTSQGIPVIGSHHSVCLSDNLKDKRLRVSVWIHDADFSIVIDCGPDFRQQMLTSKCVRLDALLFTHEHADHTAGLDDIRPFYFAQGDIPIYAHDRVLKNLARRFDYIFEKENKYPGAPSVVTHEVKENESFSVKNQTIIPINAMHGNLQVFGYRIKDFVYLTDVKTIEDSELDKLKNVEVLVINALRFEPHNTHFNIEEALNFINLVQPKKAYLTHISHIMGFHDEVQKQLPNNVFLAFDNLEIEIE